MSRRAYFIMVDHVIILSVGLSILIFTIFFTRECGALRWHSPIESIIYFYFIVKKRNCDKVLTWKQDLIDHTIVHTGEKPYNCVQCDKALLSLIVFL